MKASGSGFRVKLFTASASPLFCFSCFKALSLEMNLKFAELKNALEQALEAVFCQVLIGSPFSRRNSAKLSLFGISNGTSSKFSELECRP